MAWNKVEIIRHASDARKPGPKLPQSTMVKQTMRRSASPLVEGAHLIAYSLGRGQKGGACAGSLLQLVTHPDNSVENASTRSWSSSERKPWAI